MKTKIKKLLAKWSLEYAFCVLPECEFKVEFGKFLIDNIKKL